MSSTSTSYREHTQADLFPGQRKPGPVLSVLEEELGPAGVAALQHAAKRLEEQIQLQKRNEQIRREFFTLKAETSWTKAAEKIMAEYDLSYDNLDWIIYPRLHRKR